MRPVSTCLVLHLACLALATPAGAQGKKAPAAAEQSLAERLARRTLDLDEPAGPGATIRVAKGITTTLSFQVPVRATDLADAGRFFEPPKSGANGGPAKSVLLTPTKELGSAVATLLVTLENGLEVPLQLVGAGKGQVDAVVTVVSKSTVPQCRAAVAPSASAACCTSAAQLRQELDECQAMSGTDGLRKIAALILAQNVSRPEAVVFEGRSTRVLDKQSGLQVQAHQIYRIFGYTYLLVTVENRVPDRQWVLDRPQVRLTGAGADLPVVAFTSDVPVLPPAETAKVVVIVATPPKRSSSAIKLTLLEKSGNRHIVLDGINL